MLSSAATANPLAASLPTAASSAPMNDLALYPTQYRIEGLTHHAHQVELSWSDDRRSVYDAIWLRDNCPCRECRHPKTMERTYLFIEGLAPQMETAGITSAGDLAVTFQDGHRAAFAAGWLRAHAYDDWARAERKSLPRQWGAEMAQQLPRISHAAVMQSDAGLRRWIETLLRDGLVLLTEAPLELGEVERIANRVGPIRTTNFGGVFDVVSMPNPNNSAYTAAGLELHSDLANWHFPPDAQLLFCLANEATGGGSIFADGFRVAEALRIEKPESYRLLTQQPVDFRFQDETCDLRYRAPMIETDGDGAVTAIRFNNWLRGVLDAPSGVMTRLYRALGDYWTLLRDDRYRITLRLEAGQMIAFDNNRVLHGREAFDPNTGRRHLQGCYLDRDLLESRLRLLDRG